jgi:hypothetical protein
MSDTHDVVISGFDLDRIESELAFVTSQRDKLLSTLRTISFSAVDSDIKLLADQALAAGKGWEV